MRWPHRRLRADLQTALPTSRVDGKSNAVEPIGPDIYQENGKNDRKHHALDVVQG